MRAFSGRVAPGGSLARVIGLIAQGSIALPLMALTLALALTLSLAFGAQAQGKTTLASPMPTPVLAASPSASPSTSPSARPTAVLTDGDLRFPALTGRIVDQAALLTPAAETALNAKLQQLEADTGDQLVVVTLTSLQGHEIEDYGYRLGRAWGIGHAGGQAGTNATGKNNGVLLIVAPAERKVRIEVGYGLEPILTDALAARIIQTQMLPAFRQEGYTRGIDGGADAIIAQLRLDPAEAQARANAAAVEPASADVPIGPLVLVGLVFLFILFGSLRGAARGGRRRGSGVGEVLTWAALNALSNSSGGRSGGGFGGFGGGGGGGFSGGGGSFGGGGASGGW